MDIDKALSISFSRLARRSNEGRLTQEPTRSIRRPQPLVATVTTSQTRASPDATVLSTLQQSLQTLILAKSRLRHALAVSDALR